MSQGNLDPTRRFVPSGVDAQSWIGFEHRIQERRFKALLDTIQGAIARRDGVAARAALEEARELRPAAPELNTLSARVALLPIAVPSATASAFLWYRGLGAVAMFAVGIGLVMGLESIRSDSPEPVAAVAVASAPPAEDIVTPPAPPVTAPEHESTAEAVQAPAPLVPAAPSVNEIPVVATPTATTIATPKREEPVGTTGASRASSVDARPANVPNRSTFRPSVEAANDRRRETPEPVPATSREVPDDYVAASARSESRPAFPEVQPSVPSTPAIAANVAPQPVSVTAPPPPPAPVPSAAVARTATTVSPRGDDTRVAQVLNQYARAYGQLDPSAARAVWPTVDERALTRAFASLESQDVSFDRCDIDVKGNVASASCRGTASYVGKIGSRQARTEARQWNFELKLHGDDWKIEKAQAIAR
jgi:hypothetical protein